VQFPDRELHNTFGWDLVTARVTFVLLIISSLLGKIRTVLVAELIAKQISLQTARCHSGSKISDIERSKLAAGGIHFLPISLRIKS
jgi:hypothetical protein